MQSNAINITLRGRLEENEHEDLVTMSDEDSYLATRLAR